MNESHLFYLALTMTVFFVLSVLAAPILLRPSPAARRILEMVQSTRPDERTVGRKERLRGSILSLAKGLQAWIGLAEDQQLKEQLRSAGITSSGSMNMYVASRMAIPCIGLLCGALFAHSDQIFWALSSGAIGYLLPDMWLKAKTA